MNMHENTNKDYAVRFLKLISSGKIDEAYNQFVSPTGKHHSPHFAPGFNALKAAMKENYKQFPHKQSDVKRVISEDDMVATHSHIILEPGATGFEVLHLFRFKDGKIIELWDFTQRAPDE